MFITLSLGVWYSLNVYINDQAEVHTCDGKDPERKEKWLEGTELLHILEITIKEINTSKC